LGFKSKVAQATFDPNKGIKTKEIAAEKAAEVIGERRGGDRKSSVTQVTLDLDKGAKTKEIAVEKSSGTQVPLDSDKNKGKRNADIAAEKAGFGSREELRPPCILHIALLLQ